MHSSSQRNSSETRYSKEAKRISEAMTAYIGGTVTLDAAKNVIKSMLASRPQALIEVNDLGYGHFQWCLGFLHPSVTDDVVKRTYEIFDVLIAAAKSNLRVNTYIQPFLLGGISLDFLPHLSVLQIGHKHIFDAFWKLLNDGKNEGYIAPSSISDILLAHTSHQENGLHYAIFSGETKGLKAYADKLFDAYEKKYITKDQLKALILMANDPACMTPLHFACRAGYQMTFSFGQLLMDCDEKKILHKKDIQSYLITITRDKNLALELAAFSDDVHALDCFIQLMKLYFTEEEAADHLLGPLQQLYNLKHEQVTECPPSFATKNMLNHISHLIELEAKLLAEDDEEAREPSCKQRKCDGEESEVTTVVTTVKTKIKHRYKQHNDATHARLWQPRERSSGSNDSTHCDRDDARKLSYD